MHKHAAFQRKLFQQAVPDFKHVELPLNISLHDDLPYFISFLLIEKVLTTLDLQDPKYIHLPWQKQQQKKSRRMLLIQQKCWFYFHFLMKRSQLEWVSLHKIIFSQLTDEYDKEGQCFYVHPTDHIDLTQMQIFNYPPSKRENDRFPWIFGGLFLKVKVIQVFHNNLLFLLTGNRFQLNKQQINHSIEIEKTYRLHILPLFVR